MDFGPDVNNNHWRIYMLDCIKKKKKALEYIIGPLKQKFLKILAKKDVI